MRKGVLTIGVVAMVSLSALMLSAQSSIVDVARGGDAAALRALLGRKADVNATAADGTTALHWAARRDDVAMVEALLRAGAKVGATTRLGVTPLQLAATNGSVAVITRLLTAGADPNTVLPDGETVLMTASRTGAGDAVRALLDRGADLRRKEPAKGQTALMWAAAENNAAVVTLLIERGADVKERSKSGSFTPFLFAVRGGHVEASMALLDAGVNVNETLPDGTSALLLAVINAHYELASALLDRGANPNADGQGWTALHQIAWSRRHNAGFNLPGPVATGGVDSLDLVRKLVAKGADVNARQKKEPRDGNRNLLNRLGSTPFLLAAKADDVPLMRVLLECGADAHMATNNGTTPLMAAAGVGIWAPGENPGTHEEALAAVKLAFEAGGDVNAIDKEGETALHGAVYRGGAIPVIQFLIDKGSRLDVVNKKGWTPLTAADGVEYTPAVLKRYPEAAALLRRTMRERGMPVPDSTQPGAGGAGSPRLAVQDARSTIWDGVYTEEQAKRGEQSYAKSCAKCHAEDLLGSTNAPALIGQPFFARFDRQTADDLLDVIRRTMPQEAPDTLGIPVYADIVSYVLRSNGAPGGKLELPADRAKLRDILVTSRQ
ncbi:MAG TPA: ankyrin repeat domain-containing protein [Vicinamibacterales bacterium]|nr:ankyrin repeat domain-containing protein [Vicinamibacterales bacterium]